MKKWIIIPIFVVIILSGLFFGYYHSISSKEKSVEQHAIERAKKATSLKQVTDVNFYHGTKAYQVISGVDQKGHHVFVWVPEGKGKIIEKNASKGWSKKKVVQYIKQERQPKSIVDVRLGMEHNIPIWEVVYIDQNNRYTYHYLRFSDGTLYKRYSLQKA